MVIKEKCYTDENDKGERIMEYKTSEMVLLHGDPAVATFDMMEELFVDLRPEIQKARMYAKSDSPVLIEASAGPELEMLAQAIHNGSDRKGKPYAVISLSGTTNEEQKHVLFGDPKRGLQGAILDCNLGTLMIQGIDKLTLPMQSQLARVLRTKRVMNQVNVSQYRYVDVRFICSTSKNLTELRNQFLFRSDLLFTLRALRVRIPKLKSRPSDIRNMLDFYFNDFDRKYGSKHTLTENAWNTILKYPWDSNILQLSAFCERMLLTAPKQVIHTAYVKELFSELYEKDSGIYDRIDSESVYNVNGPEAGEFPKGTGADTGYADAFSQDSKADKNGEPLQPSLLPKIPESNDIYRDLIVACLRQNNGNKKATAKQLGISTTTLWRKLQYYHLN